MKQYRLAIARPAAGDVMAGGDASHRARRRFGGMYAASKGGPRPIRRCLSEATVASHLFGIRQAAAALLAMGVAREELSHPRALVVPAARAADILDHYAERVLSPSALKAIANTLRSVAEHHVGLPADEVAMLRGWTKEAAGPRLATLSCLRDGA